MRRALELLLPGVALWRRGWRVEGGGAFLLWGGLLLLLLIRIDRVATAWSQGGEERVALFALLGTVVATWWWSVRRGSGGEGSTASAGLSGWEGFWVRFRENRMAVVGLAVVLVAVLGALLAPFLAPFDPTILPAYQGGEVGRRLEAPSLAHLLGTDHFGRDVLTRIIYGARISLSIGVLVMAISVPMGTLLGAVAAYRGGWVDTLVMRFVDTVMAFPRIVLLILLVALFHPSVPLMVAALALTQWPASTRIVRGEVLALKEREFVEAARALGYSAPRILFRHILPNAMAPIIVVASLGVGNTIVLEAGLSFLGLGLQPPDFSWGTMVMDGRGHLTEAWWMSTFPGLAIVLVVLSFNLVGDGLRDVLDPRQGKEVGK